MGSTAGASSIPLIGVALPVSDELSLTTFVEFPEGLDHGHHVFYRGLGLDVVDSVENKPTPF